MYILMLVTSMLMLLALLTYGRIESYRGFSFVQSQFEIYVEKTEREYANEKALKKYQSIIATSRNPTENENEQNPASSKLSFKLFVDRKTREEKPEEFEQNREIAKNLIHVLYNNQPFYEKIEAKRPDFVNEIFAAIMRETDFLTDEQKLTKTKELANIDLKDTELNDVFTKMLKGVDFPQEDPQLNEEFPDLFTETNPSGEMYESFLDFITLTSNKLTLRVFLASKPILTALFGSPVIADEIISKRYELYRNLVNADESGENYKDIGSQEFKDQFLDSRLPYVKPETLDFGISKTNPRSYD